MLVDVRKKVPGFLEHLMAPLLVASEILLVYIRGPGDVEVLLIEEVVVHV